MGTGSPVRPGPGDSGDSRPEVVAGGGGGRDTGRGPGKGQLERLAGSWEKWVPPSFTAPRCCPQGLC